MNALSRSRRSEAGLPRASQAAPKDSQRSTRPVCAPQGGRQAGSHAAQPRARGQSFAVKAQAGRRRPGRALGSAGDVVFRNFRASAASSGVPARSPPCAPPSSSPRPCSAAPPRAAVAPRAYAAAAAAAPAAPGAPPPAVAAAMPAVGARPKPMGPPLGSRPRGPRGTPARMALSGRAGPRGPRR